MNLVVLTGRAVKSPEIRYTTGEKQICVANVTLAVDKWDGKQKSADFIKVTAFGKTAETMEKYVGKGQMIGIIGKISTGNYEKDGQKHYVTNIIVDRMEFLSKSEKTEEERASKPPKGFSHLEDDISFDVPF